jgi:hypothetical protein
MAKTKPQAKRPTSADVAWIGKRNQQSVRCWIIAASRRILGIFELTGGCSRQDDCKADGCNSGLEHTPHPENAIQNFGLGFTALRSAKALISSSVRCFAVLKREVVFRSIDAVD